MSEIENVVLPYLASHARSIYQLSMMLWDTSVSFTINRHWARFIHSLIHLFIHSFHLISTAARARQASISFFSHFYLIPPAQMQKKREREREREVKIAFSLSLRLFYSIRQKLLIINNELLSWSLIHWTTSLNERRKEKKKPTGSNHKSSLSSSYTFFCTRPKCECIRDVYIWSCMRTFPLWI